MPTPVTADWMLSRLETPALASGSKRISRSLSVTAERIFAKDWAALSEANAVLAILDGPVIDDGTACEIGIFYGLMRSDPSKKGIVGMTHDLRSTRELVHVRIARSVEQTSRLAERLGYRPDAEGAA